MLSPSSLFRYLILDTGTKGSKGVAECILQGRKAALMLSVMKGGILQVRDLAWRWLLLDH